MGQIASSFSAHDFRLDVVDGVEEEAAGAFSMRIHSPKVESFESHYFALTPANSSKLAHVCRKS